MLRLKTVCCLCCAAITSYFVVGVPVSSSGGSNITLSGRGISSGSMVRHAREPDLAVAIYSPERVACGALTCSLSLLSPLGSTPKGKHTVSMHMLSIRLGWGPPASLPASQLPSGKYLQFGSLSNGVVGALQGRCWVPDTNVWAA